MHWSMLSILPTIFLTFIDNEIFLKPINKKVYFILFIETFSINCKLVILELLHGSFFGFQEEFVLKLGVNVINIF